MLVKTFLLRKVMLLDSCAVYIELQILDSKLVHCNDFEKIIKNMLLMKMNIDYCLVLY